MPVTLNANSSTGFIATSDTSAILQLQTAGTTALTVDTSANVGIGTASPGTKLTVDGTVRATTIQAVNSVSSVNQFVSMTVDSVGANINSSFVSSGNAHLLFSTSNTERMRVLGSAPILCLSGGNTSATGTGIAFPATQSASTDANTLDDYEEGTFTPAFSATGATWTYSSQSGVYVKVGQMVTAQFYIKPSSLSGTTTGNAFITNLPFASTNAGVASLSQFSAAQWSTSAISNIPLMDAGTTNAYMWKQGTSVTIMTAAEVGTSYYVGTFTYRAST
jgi:hypothetical protein